MNTPQLRLTLLGLALGVLLAIIIAPQTRWLVRLQTLTALRLYHPWLGSEAPAYTASAAEDKRQMQAVIAKHPDDFAYQYAYAIDGEGNALGSPQAVAALRGLDARFSTQPALYANILRYAANGLHWNRTEENALYGLPGLPEKFHPIPNDPAALAAFDRGAAAGEQLDSNNAYFPIMRAAGLFAAHRDADGLAAVARAARETEWQEYIPEEVEARRRLHEAAFGDPGALPHAMTAYATLFPQYTLLRALARLLRYKAVEAEQAGRLEQGLQLREELRHFGDLMRVQSTTLIGSLVGIAITAIATSDPGGVALPKEKRRLSSTQIKQRNLDAYCAYVTRIGHPEAAVRARAEYEAAQKIEAIIAPDHFPDMTAPIVRLAAWWLGGLAALSNILWLLVFGGLAAGLAHTQWANRSREGARMEGKAAIGLRADHDQKTVFAKRIALAAMSVVVPFLLADFSLHLFNLPNWLSGTMHGVEELCFLLAVFGLPSALAVYLMRQGFRPPRFSRPPSLRKIGTGLLVGVCVYGVFALVWWQAGSLADFVGGALALIQDGGNVDTNAQAWRHWLSFAAALAVPLLLAIVLGIAACVRRVPVSVGLVRGFRAAALPATCVLLLVYGGLLLGTARQERVVNDQVWHSSHDEGRHLAAQAGLPWPGPIH